MQLESDWKNRRPKSGIIWDDPDESSEWRGWGGGRLQIYWLRAHLSTAYGARGTGSFVQPSHVIQNMRKDPGFISCARQQERLALCQSVLRMRVSIANSRDVHRG